MSKWKFNNAKWDIMSAFNNVDNDDIPNSIKELENITIESDEARRILMPVIEATKKINKQINDSKALFERLQETQYEEFKIPEDGDGNEI